MSEADRLVTTAPLAVSSLATKLSAPTVSGPAIDQETARGAAAFSQQLAYMGSAATDGADLLAKFLRLQVQDSNTSGYFAQLLETGRGVLRAFAFVEERRLRSLLPTVDALKAEAEKLEAEGDERLNKALGTLKQTHMSAPDPTSVFGGGRPKTEPRVDIDALTNDMWLAAALDGLDEIHASYELSQEADRLQGQGKHEEAAALRQEALELDMGIKDGLSALGLPATDDTLRELKEHAASSIAKGRDSLHTFGSFLAAHPELASKVAPGRDPASLANGGFTKADLGRYVESVVQKLDPEQREELLGESLGNMGEASLRDALDPYLEKHPVAMGKAMPYFLQAAEKYEEANEKAARARAIEAKYEDALYAMRDARSAEQTHGVAQRMSEDQEKALRSVQNVLTGLRAGRDEAQQAWIEADKHRNEVARLVQDLVEKNNAAARERRRIM